VGGGRPIVKRQGRKGGFFGGSWVVESRGRKTTDGGGRRKLSSGLSSSQNAGGEDEGGVHVPRTVANEPNSKTVFVRGCGKKKNFCQSVEGKGGGIQKGGAKDRETVIEFPENFETKAMGTRNCSIRKKEVGGGKVDCLFPRKKSKETKDFLPKEKSTKVLRFAQ